ncbi:uncharacterized protein LOC124422863 [Vespa crabro]|uniref:uncharacterized protein LOC124422863 n=1 Tax=Vespa crabro TaxID=7445 RepID=UPI001F002F87|nr:uncharacterized protein LOC124422863 [Vespa crabro]
MDSDRVSYVDYASGWNQKIMKFMGIWPEERGFANACSYKVLFTIGFMFLFITLPQTTNLYFIWGDFELIVENLSVGNMTTTIAILKTATFWSNRRTMKVLLSHMESDRKEAKAEENIKKMMSIGVISRKIIAGSIIMCNFVALTFVTFKTLLLPYTGRVLYYRAYFPYDTRIFPNFEITLIGQIAAAIYVANSYTAVDTFMAMLMLHVCGQFSNLRRKLTKLCSESNRNFHIDLRRIVRKYDMLNRYAETIEDRFNGMLLIQMLSCTVQLCVQSYQAISALVDDDQGLLIVRLFFFAIYTTYVMLHIYLYCYVGEKLFSEGTKIAYAAYDCNWYDLSPKEAKCLIIIMCRAQLSSRITAGKFCSFNHELFGKILKTSMGYLSVLYAMKTKDIGQITAALYAANSYTAVDTFMTMLVLHVCGQFSSLRKNLTQLCSESNKNFRIDLARIVEKYDMLNRYAETIDDRFNGMLLVQMLGCTMQLCVQFYQAISFFDEFLYYSKKKKKKRKENRYIYCLSMNYIAQAISVLLSHMEEDRKETNTEEEARRMMRIAKICRRISIGCNLTYYIIIILFIILHILLVRYIGHILIIRSYFPYNIQSTPNYELTVLGQTLAAYCAAGVYTSVDTFVATLVFHVCGQLKNLKQRLRDLCCEKDNEDFFIKIGQIVKKHDSLSRFVNTIENNFNDMFLLQMVGCTVQLCVMCFLVLLTLGGKDGIILIQIVFLLLCITYVLLQIYLYCYIGEELISESIGIMDAVYECEWYDLSSNKARSLIMIMIRAKVPFFITAGKFCSFSHKLFCNILRTSMSYLSVLHAMNIVNTE